MFLRMDAMVEESGISRWTLMKELQLGRLHGVQNGKGGVWRAKKECFDAWMLGEPCEHQQEVAA